MKIGFIGCGNMGRAMINGILQSGLVKNEELIASAKSEETCNKIKNDLQIQLAASNREVAQFSDLIFLAVKPQYYAQVIAEIKDRIRPEQIVVSIAPGKTLAWLEGLFGRPVKLVRTMPNTPAMVGEGMTAYSVSVQVTPEEKEQVAGICRCFGKAEEVDESMMDAVTSVSGSSPAYVFLFIEAMADAAVADGIKGYGMLSGRYNDRSRACFGGKRNAQQRDRGNESMCKKSRRDVKIICAPFQMEENQV